MLAINCYEATECISKINKVIVKCDLLLSLTSKAQVCTLLCHTCPLSVIKTLGLLPFKQMLQFLCQQAIHELEKCMVHNTKLCKPTK